MVTSITSPMNKAPKQVQQNMQQKQPQQQKAQWTPQRPQKSRSNGSVPSSQSSTPNGKNSKAVKRVHSSPVAQGGGGGAAGQQQHQQKQLFRTPSKNIPARKNSSHTPRASPRASQTPSPRCFAGSKCYEPPTPQSLPKPPSTWMQMAAASPAAAAETIQSSTPVADDPISKHLMLLLKVQN